MSAMRHWKLVRVLSCMAVALCLAGMATLGLQRTANAASSGLAISTSPAMTPGFDPSIINYTAPCGKSTSTPTTVAVSVSAPAGTTVSVDGTSPQSGAFSVGVPRAWGQAFNFAVTSGGPPVTYHVRCLPSDFPAYTAQHLGSTQSQYYIMAFGVGAYVAIVDANGVPVWWFKDGPNLSPVFATLLSSGNMAWTNQTQSPRASANAQVYTLGGARVATLNSPDNPPSDIHDIQLLPNGNYVLVVYPTVSGVDMTSIGGTANTCIIDAEVEEITPSGALVWSWFARQHISPTEINPEIQATAASSSCTTPKDVWHLNSYDDAGGDFILSLRYTGVYRINKASGNVVWKLGGSTTPQSLTVSGDTVSPPGGFGQHDARLYGDGSVSIFDNGNVGNASSPHARAPRVVRYSIDTTAGTATVAEQITDPAVTATPTCCGSARRLPGGNWVIGWGSDNVETEVTPTGARLFAMSSSITGLFTYRNIPVLPGTLSAATLQSDMDAMNPVPPYWRLDAAPQAGSASTFNAMKALNATDVWAAGSYVQNGANRPFVDHWNGVTWARLVAPFAGSSSQFTSISPLSDTDVWAGGTYVQGSTNYPFVEHWNGGSWQVLAAPRGGSGSTFTSMTALSDTDVWAGGSYLVAGVNYPYVEHWNGTTWQVLAAQQGGNGSQFTAIRAISDTDVWAAGFYVIGGVNEPFVEQWNGTTWNVLPAAQGGSAGQFTSMTVLGDNDVWAAGFYVISGVNYPMVEHWNGTAWTLLPATQGGSASQFTSITALSDTDVWAAGSYSLGGVTLPFVEQWNGSAWNVLPAIQGGSASQFNAMTALSDTAVWAAGSYTQGGANLPLAETYGPGTT